MAISNDKDAPLSRGRGAGGEGRKGKKSIKLPLHTGANPQPFKHAKQFRRERTEAEKALWNNFVYAVL